MSANNAAIRREQLIAKLTITYTVLKLLFVLSGMNAVAAATQSAARFDDETTQRLLDDSTGAYFEMVTTLQEQHHDDADVVLQKALQELGIAQCSSYMARLSTHSKRCVSQLQSCLALLLPFAASPQTIQAVMRVADQLGDEYIFLRFLEIAHNTIGTTPVRSPSFATAAALLTRAADARITVARQRLLLRPVLRAMVMEVCERHQQEQPAADLMQGITELYTTKKLIALLLSPDAEQQLLLLFEGVKRQQELAAETVLFSITIEQATLVSSFQSAIIHHLSDSDLELFERLFTQLRIATTTAALTTAYTFIREIFDRVVLRSDSAIDDGTRRIVIEELLMERLKFVTEQQTAATAAKATVVKLRQRPRTTDSLVLAALRTHYSLQQCADLLLLRTAALMLPALNAAVSEATNFAHTPRPPTSVRSDREHERKHQLPSTVPALDDDRDLEPGAVINVPLTVTRRQQAHEMRDRCLLLLSSYLPAAVRQQYSYKLIPIPTNALYEHDVADYYSTFCLLLQHPLCTVSSKAARQLRNVIEDPDREQSAFRYISNVIEIDLSSVQADMKARKAAAAAAAASPALLTLKPTMAVKQMAAVTVATASQCAICLTAGSGKLRCSRCHSVSYCGAAHQKQHWSSAHKQQCVKQ